ncbi:hypothetical protein [Streptomyces acidiscabies]|uniref:hypothetical protein n=1 Tax=Streptomyces acidiscabies TaxID=42234 RepID=UPI000B03B849|nr:hypothetical protein [Streptomyces acidiscabies]
MPSQPEGRDRADAAEKNPYPRICPGDLWHALSQLHHTHPAPVGRVGPLACPVGLLSFAAATDTVLAARVQLPGAETMHELNETLRAITGGMHARFTGPGVALEVTLGRRQELPIHQAHTIGLTQIFRHAAGTIGARSTPGGGRCFHCGGTGTPAPCGSLPGTRERHARRTPAPRAALLDGVGCGRDRHPVRLRRRSRAGRAGWSGCRAPVRARWRGERVPWAPQGAFAGFWRSGRQFLPRRMVSVPGTHGSSAASSEPHLLVSLT